jgi:hypothetical protein
MKKKLFLTGTLACALAFGIMIFAGCDMFNSHACSNQSECNDGDYQYCGDSKCESSQYYSDRYGDYAYTCDGTCDGE